MPFLRITREWDFQVKEMHTVRLEVQEGFFNDTMRVFVDGYEAVKTKAGMSAVRGSVPFEIDGRTFDLAWVWNMWTGNPASIVIAYDGRVFAQVGTDRALRD